jgi:xanthine dehydrogenase accessory factor
MTHDHQLDQVVIEWALAAGFGFVGGVGSRAKAARTRARLEAKGVAAADIARVRMPVGVEIAARTPAEIGVAIAGELVAWRASHGAKHREIVEEQG